MAKKMAKMDMAACYGCACNCGHHKWGKALGLILAGLVLMYTTWGWGGALLALGVLALVSGNCKCCGHGM